MSDSENAAGKVRFRGDRFQFSIRQMLLLTVVCALLAGILTSFGMNAPIRTFVTFYLIVMAAYLVLRLPYCWSWIVHKTPEWDEFRQRRADLEEAVRNLKGNLERARAEDRRPM